jgi:hypothetical protein
MVEIINIGSISMYGNIQYGEKESPILVAKNTKEQ